MILRRFRDEALGVALTIDAACASSTSVFASDQELPSAHRLASEPAEGWIAALAIVTVRVEPLPADEWLARQLARARASFATWSPRRARDAGGALSRPAELAGRPAVHVRYRLSGSGRDEAAPTEDGGSVAA